MAWNAWNRRVWTKQPCILSMLISFLWWWCRWPTKAQLVPNLFQHTRFHSILYTFTTVFLHIHNNFPAFYQGIPKIKTYIPNNVQCVGCFRLTSKVVWTFWRFCQERKFARLNICNQKWMKTTFTCLPMGYTVAARYVNVSYVKKFWIVRGQNCLLAAGISFLVTHLLIDRFHMTSRHKPPPYWCTSRNSKRMQI